MWYYGWSDMWLLSPGQPYMHVPSNIDQQSNALDWGHCYSRWTRHCVHKHVVLGSIVCIHKRHQFNLHTTHQSNSYPLKQTDITYLYVEMRLVTASVAINYIFEEKPAASAVSPRIAVWLNDRQCYMHVWIGSSEMDDRSAHTHAHMHIT